MTRLLPLLVLIACGPAETPAPEVPSIEVCDAWGARKLGECAEALARAPVPRNPDRKGRLHGLSLTDQCALFDSRRTALAECTAMTECDAYAECTVRVAVDDWVPAADPGLCESVVRRRLGTARPLLQEKIDALTDPKQREAAFAELYAMTDRCATDPAVRERLGLCMREYDETFAACLLTFVGESLTAR
ncbi:MAG: hypothetical protein EP330_31125 [Deltaproteobacteria bacterium]|nr:MAG: hypothetical protein EP330_31125 [Deltaproteobacteria bacterium]